MAATIPKALAVAVEHHEAGRLQAAEQIYRQILAVAPNQHNALHLLGLLAHQVGQYGIAVECIGRALELKPDDPEAFYNLGNAFGEQGRLDESIACYRRAVELNSEHAAAHSNLGNVLKTQGKLDEAVDCYRRALDIRPNAASAHYNLGNAHQEQGRLDEAIACYRRALDLDPENFEAISNLGSALNGQKRLDEAVACYQRALDLRPGSAAAHYNFGNAIRGQRKLDEAISCFRRALELQPDLVTAHSNLVYTLHFCPGCDARMIYAEHRRWSQRHAEPLATCIRPHAHERSAERRLRIGYVSPDFRNHVVGLFLLPLLEAHNHEHVNVFCYSSVAIPDSVTEQCRAHADVWRDVPDFSDEQLAEAIRQDQVDILVDLSMHTANNRLLVFARKPAPVQVTYLAYAATTGLSTIDYRLTDPYLDPPNQQEPIFSEQSIRLPETFWCYRPLVPTGSVNPLPALNNGFVTFGCLNNFCKVSDQTLTTWIGLLQTMPMARLHLHAPAGSSRDRLRELFDRQGIQPERLRFIDEASLADYFQLYHQIDVALDPFPFGGGTTTCDALWMGVPVVSLAGRTAVGRGGLSILSNVGLLELVADDVEQYIRIAVELAGDLRRLSELRATLRDRLQRSPLMDAPRFARHVETAFREMWRQWCAGAPVAGQIVNDAGKR